jgi:zinc/manganese transport system ATP-binding protein
MTEGVYEPIASALPGESSPPVEGVAAAPVVALDSAAVRIAGRTIWRDATLAITPGEFVVVLGPNGAGKSTLLRVLLGLQPLGAGSVRVFGEPPRRGNPAIGYVPQRRLLDPDLAVRGRDLVSLGLDGHRWGFTLPTPGERRQRRALVEDVLAAVDATAYADRPIGRLSGGEQQRLMIAQALIGMPRLLLLDEPLASLDLRNQIAIAELVARLARARGLTVLLVAHDINPLLPVLDRVLYVAHGHVAIDTPEALITTERLSALYEAPVEVVRDGHGRVFVVGLENEAAHVHE